MAYQGTNLVPSSQQDSCTVHGFAAAEVGLHPGCGAAFSSAEDLHGEGYDFGTLYHPDPVVNDTGVGYGPPSSYRNDLLKDSVAAEAYTGHADPLSASLWNNASATTRVDYGWNSISSVTPAVNNIVESSSGNGYGVSTGYQNDMFTADIAANDSTGYNDPLSAPLRNTAGATPYIDYGRNSAYTPAPVVNNIVGSGSNNGYGCSTGYHNDMFTADIAAVAYTGHADPLSTAIENNTGATPYIDYGQDSAYTPAPVVKNIVGSGPGNGYRVSTGYHNDMFTADIAATGYTGHADQLGASLGNNADDTTYTGNGWNPTYTPAPVVNNIVGSGSGTGSGMPPLQPNIGIYNPGGPTTTIGPARVPCTHPNCSRTFGRPSDMARHAKKHELNPVRYPCPVPGCAFTGAKAFLRHDKLLSHGRNTHGMEL